MTDESSAQETQLTFHVKASSDAKLTVNVSSAITVHDLKVKLSTAEYANIPPERQRLIYSGRVMKDPETLATYKIKDGNTVHLVKSAESAQRSNPAAQQSSTTPAVPQNLATGTANDPLAALTGARYAGFHNLPSSDMFGPDGGMTPQNPEDMLRRMEDPAFISQMNEAMNNPDVVRMLANSPQFRDNPQALRMLQDPNMRRMLMDPNVIRQSMQIARNMGLGGQFGTGGGAGSGGVPMPGTTDTTAPQSGTSTNSTTDNASGGAQQPFNPFAQLFGAGGPAGTASGGAPAGGADPFAGLFGAGNNASGAAGAGTNSTAQGGDAAANPFAAGLGGAGGLGGMNPQMMQAAMDHMRQNPEQMRMAMNAMFGGMPGGAEAGAGGGGQGDGAAFNPFAAFGGFGGLGGQQQPQQPQDTRPPEEQYADQLRQLNDMGFFDFNQNVRALRMSGGRVEGAVEIILSGAGAP